MHDTGGHAAPPSRTPLFSRHQALGGKIVPFAGFEMPVQYTGVIEEHRAVRTAAGLFDVSHMGEFEIRGRDAAAFLDHITPSRISALDEMRAAYSGLMTPDGAFVDDILVYRLAADRFLMVVNAANTAKDWEWVVSSKGRYDVTLENQSAATALIACQGPLSLELVAGLAEGFEALGLKYYHATRGKVAGRPTLAARTGYTGEVGYELFLTPEDAGPVWDALMEAGARRGLRAAGLGARDTLRLEAAMPLYGNDIDETTSVLEAGLEWIIDWTKESFVGRAPLLVQKERGPARRRVGFELREKGIARHGAPILLGGASCGAVTSGTWSPTLEKAIGMAYLPSDRCATGTEFEIDVRGRRLPAVVVNLPFYRRPKRGAGAR